MIAVTKAAWIVGLMVCMGMLAACGELRNPFEKPKVFAATPVPADFAVVLDESPDTHYARQNVHQVVTASDLASRVTYTTFTDYQNRVADSFTDEFPVTQGQMQALWNEVVRNDLMTGAEVWYFWKTNPDNYLRNERRIQIRANGKVAEFRTLNHWGYRLRDLAMQVRAVNLPVTRKGAVVPGAATAP